MARSSGPAKLGLRHDNEEEDEPMLTIGKSRQFWLQACTRCHGDAFLDQSEYEPEWRCLQCGRTVGAIAQPALAFIGDGRERTAA